MDGVKESQCRAGDGLDPPPPITKVLGELVLGEVHGEDSLRVDGEMCEDPGKDGGKVGRMLGTQPG